MIDWQAVGTAVAALLAGAGAVIGATWKRLKSGAATPPPSAGQDPVTLLLLAEKNATEYRRGHQEVLDELREIGTKIESWHDVISRDASEGRRLLAELGTHRKRLVSIAERQDAVLSAVEDALRLLPPPPRKPSGAVGSQR